MTESIFEIVTLQPLQQGEPHTAPYSQLLRGYCSTNYGLYTEQFLKRICGKAQAGTPALRTLNLKPILRRVLKKYLMSDLELVFLDHYCAAGGWAIHDKALLREITSIYQLDQIDVPDKILEIFVEFNAYFVKSYIGDTQEFAAIGSYNEHMCPWFQQVFHKWVASQPQQTFIIKPRTINELYREYSKGCQIETNQKDYNELVDTLIELSTSYSIIPNKKVDSIGAPKPRGAQRKVEPMEESVVKPRPNNRSRYEAEPRRMPSIIEYESRSLQRRSSLLFDSLPGMSKRSSVLQAVMEPLKNNPIPEPEQPEQPEQPERSRQKKPANKVSINFRRKEKPNETVLNFLRQPSAMELKSQVLGVPQPGNNSILGDNNYSFINLRSTRSSQANSQMVFPWSPSDYNYFDKSKLI